MILGFRRDNTTTNEIVEILFDGRKEHQRISKGFKCYFSLYKCNLSRNDVPNLFEFAIDKSLSVLNPRILINIPEGEVADIYRHDEKYNYNKLNYMIQMFSEDIIKKYGKELTCVVFSILHEVGHWEYICNNNYSPQEFEEIDGIERKAFYENNNEENDSEEEFWEYRKITSEKEADKYAMSELKNALEYITNNKKDEHERE